VTASTVLILGGTGEAAALASAALDRFGDALEVTTSLAGRTRRPAAIPGRVRIGGFGGPAGLAAYLERHEIDRLVDATHPFAVRISRAARLACDMAGVPRLVLRRPPWRRQPGDDWIEVDGMAEAARAVRCLGKRAWLTVGTSELSAFSGIGSVHFLVRLAEPPLLPLPLCRCEVIVGRGPFTLSEERRRFAEHAIDVLVAKASGGAATAAKLAVARELAVPVVMLRRPPPEPGDAVETIPEALAWLAAPRCSATGREP
jgi:precorrin-6A/cobalt-precorrin-6A reductase